MRAAALQGASRESLAASRETLATLVRTPDTDLEQLAGDLFVLTELLDRERALRRALTDPARSSDDRAGLARAVAGPQVGAAALDVFVWAVRARWSGPRDLADALEILGVDAQIAASDRAGRLDAVEDQLFRVGRIVAGNADLRIALSDRSAPAEARAALLEGLVGTRVAPETGVLLRQAVIAPRGRTFDSSVELFGRVAAEQRSRLVATVTAAVPLTTEQRTRLGNALRRIYGAQVHLNVQVDPHILGGLSVEIGDEVIDGSVSNRLQDARRRLAG